MRRTTLLFWRLFSNNMKGFVTLNENCERFSTSLKASVTNESKQYVEISDWGRDFIPYNKLLKKFADSGKLKLGKVIHARFLNSVFRHDISIQNSIINMYSKCGSLTDAYKYFEYMPFKDMVTWTMMITAYSYHDKPDKSLQLFRRMVRNGFKPNKFTFSTLFKASGTISSVKYGTHIHALCIKYGCDVDVYVGTSVVDMYARWGYMDEARVCFDGLLTKNEASWNAVIAGHGRKDEGDKALFVFRAMKREGFNPDQFSYCSIFSACASSGALEQGKWIHAHVIKSGTKLTAFVGHTLLHMYAKTGRIEDAEKVFARLMERNIVSWNSMLTGYAQHGLGKKTLDRFEAMLGMGIEPNEITFLCVLTACSHSGLLEQGRSYFDMMKLYGLEPKPDHYVAIVDLLGRAGKFDEALGFISDMPVEPVSEIWKALLGACRVHGRVDLGLFVAKRVFELDPYDSGPYVILSNIYASFGRKDDVAKVRKMMKESGARKEPACSWVEIENSVHMFVAGDDSHPRITEIREIWASMSVEIKQFGYVSDTDTNTTQVVLFLDEY